MSYQNDNIDYHSKYLKYKKKYLDLQSKIEGGATSSFEEIVTQVESKLKEFDANLKKKVGLALILTLKLQIIDILGWIQLQSLYPKLKVL